MVCGAWLAIDRACTPSCCLTCKDCNWALSSAMLASTRLPMPLVRAADSFWAKSTWIENFFEPDDSFASAAAPLLSEVWIPAPIVDAAACVEIDAPEDRVTIEP